MVHRDALATAIREESVSPQEPVLSVAGRGQPAPPCAGVEESLRPRVLVRWCPGALCAVVALMSVLRKSYNSPSDHVARHLSLVWLKYQSVSIAATAEGCGLEFLDFKSCPYWRRRPA